MSSSIKKRFFYFVRRIFRPIEEECAKGYFENLA
ncbi:hypothetical protein DET65_3788 [Sunxiuqinia elliptica]|uniref:Uncharacterized protein n=1 Tax=Sunxiuqinia elliptica TaxID=655355 RepID=A0A4R6GWU5_9BACT|nr:hypothetical protein DET52_106224 [Sunxiuqinia elliptica]TDO57203.1 hypothetical protein DET65_3788 [Sunxiuqinia elliptica]